MVSAKVSQRAARQRPPLAARGAGPGASVVGAGVASTLRAVLVLPGGWPSPAGQGRCRSTEAVLELLAATVGRHNPPRRRGWLGVTFGQILAAWWLMPPPPTVSPDCEAPR